MTPGRWLELRARWSAAAAAPDDEFGHALGEDGAELADALLALGGRAVEERGGWLITHVPEPADSDGFPAETVARLEARVGASIETVVAWREVEDWAETWKRGLSPRRITARLWVTPSWEVDALLPRLEPGVRVLVIDPGMAFGTAEHGTTRGALRLLDRAIIPGARVLDVGAGSAILAIAAALLGAGEVVAMEGDPVAGEYGRENLFRNHVSEQVRWVEAWADAGLLRTYEPVDGVLANIESGVLRQLLPGFRDALRPGGWLILSGVLGEEWSAFLRDVERGGFVLADQDADGEWRSGWFVRQPGPAPSGG